MKTTLTAPTHIAKTYAPNICQKKRYEKEVFEAGKLGANKKQ